MADSQAVRQRRHRLHAAGDHSLCRPSRCEAVRGQADTAPDDELPSVSSAVRDVIDGLGLEDFDVLWPELEYTLALAIRFDRGEAVATHLRPALAHLQHVAHMRQYVS